MRFLSNLVFLTDFVVTSYLVVPTVLRYCNLGRRSPDSRHHSTISIVTRSVTPPLKSAQTRKMFSVGVIAPSLVRFACNEAVTNIMEGLERREAARSVQWSAINTLMMPISAAAIDTKSAAHAN